MDQVGYGVIWKLFFAHARLAKLAGHQVGINLNHVALLYMLLNQCHWELDETHGTLGDFFLAEEGEVLFVLALGHHFVAIFADGYCSVWVALIVIRLFTIGTIRVLCLGNKRLLNYFAVVFGVILKSRSFDLSLGY